MRIRLLLAAVCAAGALFVLSVRVGRGEPVDRVDQLRALRRRGRRGLLESCSTKARSRQVPEGAEPDPAGHERADLGRDLVLRAARAALEVRVARPEEGHGGPHRAHP